MIFGENYERYNPVRSDISRFFERHSRPPAATFIEQKPALQPAWRFYTPQAARCESRQDEPGIFAGPSYYKKPHP